LIVGDRRGLKLEQGILDQAHGIAERTAEGAQLDALADVLDGFIDDRTRCDHVLSCGLDFTWAKDAAWATSWRLARDPRVAGCGPAGPCWCR
jgi:hypothetical protein